MSIASVDYSYTAEDESQDIEYVALIGTFNVSVNFSQGIGVIALQRSFDNGATWETTNSTSDDLATTGEAVENALWRIACLEHTSGTITARLGQ